MTTVPTAPTDVTVTSTVAKDWSWITHHILSLALVGILALGGVYLVESLISKHDAANSAKYDAILAAQTQQNKANEEHWAQVESQLLAQNAQLATAVSTRNQQVAVQVKNDATLSAQDAAQRLAQQTSANAGEINAAGNTITVDLPVTRRIVASLDQLPVVQANLADTQTQLANETQVATNAKADVAGLKTEIADATKACDARVSLEKSKTRKAGLKGFFIGVATVLAGVAMHAAGI